VSYEAFVAAPQDEILRLASTLDLTWDRVLGAKLPLSRHTLSPPDADKWRKHAAVLEPVLERVAGENVRARALVS
jgi:hypothetical protein